MKSISLAFRDLRRGFGMYDIWMFQAYHDISARYKRTALGSIWIAGGMTVTSLSFAIVFGALFQQDLPTVLPYVMSGIMSFYLIGYVLTEAPEVFLSNAGIIQNNAFPFSYYIIESITKNFLIFLHNLVVLQITFAILGKSVWPHWSVSIGIVVVFWNMFFWGTVIAMLSARFRDLRYLLPYLSSLAMFLTPILYRLDDAKGRSRLLVEFNPLYPFVEMIRSPLMGFPMPIKYWVMAAVISSLGTLVWAFVFVRMRSRIPFWT